MFMIEFTPRGYGGCARAYARVCVTRGFKACFKELVAVSDLSISTFVFKSL